MRDSRQRIELLRQALAKYAAACPSAASSHTAVAASASPSRRSGALAARGGDERLPRGGALGGGGGVGGMATGGEGRSGEWCGEECAEVPEADLFAECSRARPAFVDDGA